MKTTFIYALCEPGTRTVRYIGKSVNPSRRFGQHLTQSSIKKTYLGNWLRSLGGRPTLAILREVPESEGSAAEIKYIRIARKSLGMKLVNATDGGEGVTPTPETREKLSQALRGKRKPQWCCEAWSVQRKGKAPPASVLAAAMRANTGRRLSPEHCAAVSAAQKGRPKSTAHIAAMRGVPKSLEHRAKLRAANLGKVSSPETCEKIRQANLLRWKKARRET